MLMLLVIFLSFVLPQMHILPIMEAFQLSQAQSSYFLYLSITLSFCQDYSFGPVDILLGYVFIWENISFLLIENIMFQFFRRSSIYKFYINYVIWEIRLVILKLKNQSSYLDLPFQHIVKSKSQRIKQHSKTFLNLSLSWQMLLSKEMLNAVFSTAT